MARRRNLPPATPVSGVRQGARPQAVTDRTVIRNIDAPSFAVPGETIRVTVNVGCLAPLFTDCEAAVRMHLGGQTRRVPTGGQEPIAEGTNSDFTAELTMPSGNANLQIEALDQGDAQGDWNVEDTAQQTIEAVSQQQALVQGYGPWVIGGGAVGAGAARLTDRNIVGGAALGAGVGVAGRVFTNEFGGVGSLIPDFNLDSFQLIALASLIGAGGYFLAQSDIDVGGRARQAAGRARDAAGSAASSIGSSGSGSSSTRSRRALPSS